MRNSGPPRLASKLLHWFAGKADLEDMEGDLEEVYFDKKLSKGAFKANVNYWRQVFRLLFSYGLKKRRSNASYSNYYSVNSMAMLSNHFKIAIRNFSKHKLFTSLNILGLALGMSVCLLALTISVAIYKSDEFHEKKDRIYQLNTYIDDKSEDRTYGSTFHAVGDHMKASYPFIEEIVNIKSNFNPEVDRYGNLMDFRGYFADNSFFKVFSFKLIQGNPETALAEPFSLVLTQKTAEKLFRNENPLGKTLETDLGTFTVTGVMENLRQTHFYFEMLTSYQTFRVLESSPLETDWVQYRNNYAYVLLNEESKRDHLDQALKETSAYAETFHRESEIQLESVTLEQVVPRWNISNAIGIGWDQPSILFFFTIGLLVLLPAVFNYTNLSIASALKRAKEVGVRKVVGAEKKQIKLQFIVETVLLALIALLGSLIILVPIKREFLSMVYSAEVLDTSIEFYQVATFLTFTLLVGILAGIFPAQYFARLNPIQTIKGEILSRKGASGFKKGLFVFQFFLSLFFVIGVATITKQYSNVLNHQHGFESDNVLTIPFEKIDKQVAINELRNHPDVKAITTTSSLPGLLLNNQIDLTSNDQDTIQVNQVFVGEDFTDNMNMELVWGNDEPIEQSNQNEELVLVNQQFMRSIGVFNLKKDSMKFTLNDGTSCRIVGILKDFNFEPLNEDIDPLVLRFSLHESQYALLTLRSSNIKRTMGELEDVWLGIDQKINFNASFLNDEIEEAYYFLSVQIKFFTFLSAMTIVISCLGLLGMVSYTTENRTKEIAVRKIMGASNGSLYYLLSKDFLKLILLAALIAVPFSYFFYEEIFLYSLMRYNVEMGVLEVVLSIVFLLSIGILSIYFQTSRVTRANPAGSLRYE